MQLRHALRGLGFQEQEALLAPPPEPAEGGFPPIPGAGDLPFLIAIKAHFGFPLFPYEWRELADLVAREPRVATTEADSLAALLRASRVSWETVSDDQRAVFMALPERESLRVELLKNSTLFDAITRMQMRPGRRGDRAEIESKRLREDGDGPGLGENATHHESVASWFIAGHIAELALVDPVRANDGRIVNKRLAAWVRNAGPDAVVNRMHDLACGLTNLFALALSRGAASDDPPAVAEGAEWLFDWSLGRQGGLLDSASGTSCTYHPSRVIAALGTASRTDTAARPGTPIATPQFRDKDKKGAYETFAAHVEDNLAGLRLGPEEQSRLALVQGSGKTHTFFLYRDLDRVWRPMDAYLNLEDLGAEQYGGFNYSSAITSLYFVVDRAPT